MFCKKGVLKNLAKFTGKHLCQILFFNKVADHLVADSVDITFLETSQNGITKWCKQLWTQFSLEMCGNLWKSAEEWDNN